MPRQPTVEQRMCEYLAGGRIQTRTDLEAAGFSPAGISRMVASGILSKVGSRGVMLADAVDLGDNWTPAAKFYGGSPDEPRGVICLRSALILHDLTDLTVDQVEAVEIAVPHNASHRPQGLNVRVFKLAREGSFEPAGLEWREFGGYGIHVTTPARTVADLFNPRLPVGIESHLAIGALARLVAADPVEAAKVPRFCGRLGWERSMADVYEATVAASQQHRPGGP